ncbi:MAG: hypothetical protein SXU28_11295 [Pseudomonadota bacterium]|nr:hypothetical protein [Pseudomonadota bacterium]
MTHSDHNKAGDKAEDTARQRYMLMNAARVGGLLTVVAGIAGARDIIPLPYAVSVVLAVGGMITFFFAPPLLAKRWKSKDS